VLSYGFEEFNNSSASTAVVEKVALVRGGPDGFQPPGSGVGPSVRQPRHPRWLALGRLLLAAPHSPPPALVLWAAAHGHPGFPDEPMLNTPS
jgi:hypothetical protein